MAQAIKYASTKIDPTQSAAEVADEAFIPTNEMLNVHGSADGWNGAPAPARLRRAPAGGVRMKSARERAEAAYHEGADAFSREDAVAAIERMFAEHARDQRHLCAEAVIAVDAPHSAAACDPPGWDASADGMRDAAHAAAMNAPAPGEGR
jgi:hypothetical protein